MDCVFVEAVVVFDGLLFVEVLVKVAVVAVEAEDFKSLFFAVVRLLKEEEFPIFTLLFKVLLNVDAKVVVVWVTTAVNFVNNYVCLVLFVLKLTCNTRLPKV